MEIYKCPSCSRFCDRDMTVECYFCDEPIAINNSATKIREKSGECKFKGKCIGCYSRNCLDRIPLRFCTQNDCHLNSPFNIGNIYDDGEDIFCCRDCNEFIREKGLRPDNCLNEWRFASTPWDTVNYNNYYHKLKNACDEAIRKPEWDKLVSLDWKDL
jgi:hypothetical protein